jgi:hypothetical protein
LDCKLNAQWKQIAPPSFVTETETQTNPNLKTNKPPSLHSESEPSTFAFRQLIANANSDEEQATYFDSNRKAN